VARVAADRAAEVDASGSAIVVVILDVGTARITPVKSP
jgi:hypothetical protein